MNANIAPIFEEVLSRHYSPSSSFGGQLADFGLDDVSAQADVASGL